MNKVLMASLMFFPIVFFSLAVVLVDGCIQFVNYVLEAMKDILKEPV